MMTDGEKLRITKDAIRRLRLQGPRALAEYERAYGSGCAVSAPPDKIGGGRTNRVSRPTQTRALGMIEREEEAAWRLRWYGCLRAALEELNGREGKSFNALRHDHTVARALQLYALRGAGGETMRMMLSVSRPVSDNYVRRLLREGLTAVKNEAEKAGLFDEYPDGRGAEESANAPY
ncbi:MAG: hypothetical protein SOT57_01630 [Eubacteriales bacterium]|nr:hypothetical protein [Eubacteriales bacterium]